MSRPSTNSLAEEISAIKERNRKVEADKAWETSLARKVLVCVMTYMVIVTFFFYAGLPDPFINAIVPSLAFLLSTFSFPFFRKIWLLHCYKK